MKAHRHILKALASITSAQQALEQTVQRHDKLIESQGRDIAALEQRVMELRNAAIRAEISAGTPTKDVAARYDVSSARISQIAPRRH